VCRNVGADLWTKDGMVGFRLCEKIMSGGPDKAVLEHLV
jgi:hypothetical protein